jgi:predicted DCC family thiol-disulfide oxidoreductase YuxK
MGPLRLAEPRIVAHQHADLASLGLTVEQCQRELQWVGPAGHIDSGAQAVASLLRASGGPWSVVGALLRVPPARWVAALVYRLVASNRQRLPGGTGTCALPLGAAPVSAHADPAPP